MKKLKTFLAYLFVIVGFFLVSTVLENGLIQQMYKPLGNLNGSTNSTDNIHNETGLDVDIKVTNAKASRMNGEVTVELTNNSEETIDGKYLKFDLYTKSGEKAALTRYMEVNDLKPHETRPYTLKFDAGYIERYEVSLVDDYPDKDYTFEVFGYEINTRNIFGLDLSKHIDAAKLKGITAGGLLGTIMRFFGRVFGRITVAAKSVPWWGYLGALAIIAGIF